MSQAGDVGRKEGQTFRKKSGQAPNQACSRGAEPMAGPLDARGVGINTDVTDRSQVASREQKMIDRIRDCVIIII